MNNKLKILYFLRFLACKLKIPSPDLIFPFANTRMLERELIISVRQDVFNKLCDEGVINIESMNKEGRDIPDIMLEATFERCGPVARTLEKLLNLKLGFSAFTFYRSLCCKE